MIRAEHLLVRRGSSIIIENLSLHVAQGEFVAIVGSNGAGKSTLMRALAGDLPLGAGSVYIGALAVRSEHAALLAKKRAILSQATVLSFGFRVYEVVELGRIPHAISRASASELRIVEECLEMAGVAHLRDRNYPSLSGGEQQRVQLARALAQVWDVPAPERVLLLDEPTSALDLRHQQSALALARRLADEGSTILVVLHDLNLAARYADTCVLMHEGAIAAKGTPAEVFTPEHLALAFGVHATILEHPEFACPLIVTLDPTKANQDLCTPPN